MFDEHEYGLQDEEYLNWLDEEEKRVKLEDLIVHLFLYTTLTLLILGSILSICQTLQGAA
ncbi:MAG TPA: hypothetical protein VIY48_00625 [Candidatus Paceibacterota bacterium]